MKTAVTIIVCIICIIGGVVLYKSDQARSYEKICASKGGEAVGYGGTLVCLDPKVFIMEPMGVH